jgi:hypothetical protein
MADPLAASVFQLLPTTELLRLVVDELDQDDCLAVCCSCSTFRTATCVRDSAFARFPSGLRTRMKPMWSSAQRLAWAIQMGCPLTAAHMDSAAELGRLEAMQCALSRGCAIHASATMFAARGGHLAVLKWLRARGCPWYFTTCAWAARGGNLELLVWACENGAPWKQDVFDFAVSWANETEVLTWLRAKGRSLVATW